MCQKVLQAGAVIAAAVTMLGCAREPFKTGEVTGRVTLEGKPVEGITVRFEPRQPSNAKKLPPVAFGITDADGRYRAVRMGKKQFGALVGVNQVRITVPEGNSAKIHPRYGQDRAFWAEVAPGTNVFDLELVEDPTAKKRAVFSEPPPE